MHATSAVAIAVVALSAASALAVPMGAGEGLEARSIYERAPTNPSKPVLAANPKGATVVDSTKPGSNRSSGAFRTLTVTTRPRPTACKAGEIPTVRRKPSSRKTSSKKGSLSANRAAGAANPADAKRASPAQGVVARAAGAPTPTSKTTTPASTPTPHPKGNRKGAGAVYRTITHVGKNGKTTIGHLVRGSSRTRCFAPTSRPQAKGAKAPGAALKDTATATGAAQPAGATNQAALGAKPLADPKLAARAVDILERYFSELDELD